MKRTAVSTLWVGSALLVAAMASQASALAAQAMQGPQGPFRPHPSTQEPSRLVTLDKLKAWEKELSNWGRWGPDDQRGTLNLITPEKMKQAAALIREGITVTLQHNPLKKSGSDTGAFGENVHRMARIDPKTGLPQGAIDIIQISLHDGLNSHMDALCHYAGPIGRQGIADAVIFNGYPYNLTAAGCQSLAVDKMGPGYITRGVLVDIPQMRGLKYLEPSTPIYVEDLEEWERYAGVKIGSGDALLIRGGRWAIRAEQGPWAYGQGGAGLHSSVLPWLKARDVAILISDAVNDVQPSGVQGIGRPVHQLTQVNLGLPIVDNAYLEDAAREAARLRRWEFMFTLHIFQIPGGTAAPFNALATF